MGFSLALKIATKEAANLRLPIIKLPLIEKTQVHAQMQLVLA